MFRNVGRIVGVLFCSAVAGAVGALMVLTREEQAKLAAREAFEEGNSLPPEMLVGKTVEEAERLLQERERGRSCGRS